jgi:GDP-mannose 6-dehydrogenase
MQISVFGLGYVGCVSLGCLAKMGHTVIGIDKNGIKIDQINSGKATIIENEVDILIKEGHEYGIISATTDSSSAVLQTEISIVAVGTPSTPTGHLNMANIHHVAENIGLALKNKKDFHVVLVRSTIVPGTCDEVAQIIEEKSGKLREKDFSVIANPEFLREGSAVKDFFNPPIVLIGANSKNVAANILELYSNLPAEIIVTETKTAEIMKYVNNTFHALKISFANEIGNICKSLNIDSMSVMDILVKDKQLNISPYYLKPGFAYGGSCLPKDLQGLQTIAHDNYLQVPIIDSISKTNEIQLKRALEIIEKTKKKKVCIVGLSFKADTDDLRNSPFIYLAEQLVGKGYILKIFDKNVYLSKLLGTNREYIENHIPHLSKMMESELGDAFKNSEIIIVSKKYNELDELLRGETKKVIIDLVGLSGEVTKMANYHGINW